MWPRLNRPRWRPWLSRFLAPQRESSCDQRSARKRQPWPDKLAFQSQRMDSASAGPGSGLPELRAVVDCVRRKWCLLDAHRHTCALRHVSAIPEPGKKARCDHDVMSQLRMISYWRSDQQPELPDPSVLVDPDWDTWERHRVTRFLETGPLALQWRGSSWCRICGLTQNGSADLTDGTYFWPSGLAHYVSEHAVRLPQALIPHMLREVDERERAVKDAYARGPGEWLAMLGPVQSDDGSSPNTPLP